jgi:hypothetical protein
MKRTVQTLLMLLSLSLLSCTVELEVTVPDITELTVLEGTQPLSVEVLRALEGVYVLSMGSQRFGDTIVLKHTGRGLSMFSERNVAYMITDGGSKDSTIYFAGYWRYAQLAQSGLCTLEIRTDEGAGALLKGSKPKTIIVRGAAGNTENVSNLNTGKGNQNEPPRQSMTYRFVRSIFARPRGFWVIAHRGGGRNSDRLPFSENSLELIRFAERLGANAVEIDDQ